MNTSHRLLAFAGAALLLSGCCQLLPGWPGCGTNGIDFSVAVTNGDTTCADQNGDFDLQFKVAYLDTVSGTTITKNGLAPLGDTNTIVMIQAADNDNDQRIDQVTVSIDLSCSPANPLWQDFILDDQIPVNGGVAFNVDANGQVTYQITQPTSSASSAASTAKRALGLGSGDKSNGAAKKPCCR